MQAEMSKVTNDVEEANEETGLVGQISPDTASVESEVLWQETVQPWPATFERSIGLLASPVMNAAEADHFTKSPKAGNTPLAIRRRMVSEQHQTCNVRSNIHRELTNLLSISNPSKSDTKHHSLPYCPP